MKTLTAATMLISLGIYTGLNDSQVCFVFIIAGIVTALIGIKRQTTNQ